MCAISNGSLLANQLRVNSTQQKQFEMVNNDNLLINVNLALSVWISDLLRITLPVDMDNKGTKILDENRISEVFCDCGATVARNWRLIEAVARTTIAGQKKSLWRLLQCHH